MKYVIVVENGFFKVMFDDGVELTQSREHGKACIFESLANAEHCRKSLMARYSN